MSQWLVQLTSNSTGMPPRPPLLTKRICDTHMLEVRDSAQLLVQKLERDKDKIKAAAFFSSSGMIYSGDRDALEKTNISSL